MTREEKVPVFEGAANGAENLRAVARHANQAGRDGWELIDAEVGIDREAFAERGTVHAVIRLTYRRPEGS